MKLFLTKENHEKVLQAIDDHIEKDLKYKFEKMKALKTIQTEQKNAGEYESLEIRHADVIRVKEKKSFLDRIVEFKTYNLEEDFNITIGYSSIQNDKLEHLAKIREDLVTYLLFAEGMFKYRSEVEEYTDFEFDYDKLIQFIHLVHFYLATQREENPNALDYRNLGFEHCYRIDHLLGISFNTALINEAYDDYYFDSDSIKEGNAHYFISVPSIQDNFIRFDIEFNEEEKEVLAGILSSVRLIRFTTNTSIRDLYLTKSAHREYLEITVRNKEILYIRLDNEHAESSLYTFSLNNIQARTISNGNTQTHPLPLLRVSNGTTEINICCTMDEFDYMIS
jgi:hypothetical protein|nr:MAG TPA: hypothetical protein [Caudoviricetes sp.]